MPHPWARLQAACASPVLFGDMVWVDAPAEAMRRSIFGSTANCGREVTGVSLCDIGLHAPALLYNIIPGISLLYNNGFPIIMGHKIHVILGVF